MILLIHSSVNLNDVIATDTVIPKGRHISSLQNKEPQNSLQYLKRNSSEQNAPGMRKSCSITNELLGGNSERDFPHNGMCEKEIT